MKHAPLIFVLYDGINNSVFAGQILEPLLAKLKQNPDLEVHIISFERIANVSLLETIPKHDRLHITLTKKIPFIGKPTIKYASLQLKKHLKKNLSYTLIARGPIAGLICWQSLQAHKCLSFTLQVRGLLAEEYVYAHGYQKLIIKKYLHSWRAKQLKKLELKAFAHLNPQIPFTIETISPALKEYLFNTYHIHPALISIAQDDIPSIIPKEQVSNWRAEIRSMLKIPLDAKIYCYNGSFKPWQRPEKITSYFKNKLSNSQCTSFLLILTQDIKMFANLLKAHEINTDHYQIHYVNHQDIYRYLAACDVGLLFREPHIINWVSRPTKALEYQAVHLPIEHNNTIAWLNEMQISPIS